jgi:ubiquinone/menaquinone biosynthesis C-methylase UbiE
MAEPQEFAQDIWAFWKSRAGLGQWAGTRDAIAKQLEVEAISTYVRDGTRILEIGCGNGITAIELARRHEVEIFAIDFAEEMIAAATAMLGDRTLLGSVKFQVGDIQTLSGFSQRFDLIYTERVLINLPDWAAQQKAILDITELLDTGGLYVMCENSQDGLGQINALREQVGLPAIIPPWHNRYLRDAELEQLNLPAVKLAGINDYSSTYYFLSRIVNACLAAEEGRDPEYDAPINRLALRLPSIGNLGQGRIWLWRKEGHAPSGSSESRQSTAIESDLKKQF